MREIDFGLTRDQVHDFGVSGLGDVSPVHLHDDVLFSDARAIRGSPGAHGLNGHGPVTGEGEAVPGDVVPVDVEGSCPFGRGGLGSAGIEQQLVVVVVIGDESCAQVAATYLA